MRVVKTLLTKSTYDLTYMAIAIPPFIFHQHRNWYLVVRIIAVIGRPPMNTWFYQFVLQ